MQVQMKQMVMAGMEIDVGKAVLTNAACMHEDYCNMGSPKQQCGSRLLNHI